MGAAEMEMGGVLAGIFIGGRASRMGGIAKGLLVAPDGQPIIERTRRLLEQIGVTECVLVGARGGDAYANCGLQILEDDRDAEGPLAGLLALLEHAKDRKALALACDMPLLTRDILRKLIDSDNDEKTIVAPRHDDFWEPLCACYRPSVLPIARAFAQKGGRKLQHLLDQANATAVSLTEEEQALLVDWDAPEDAASPVPGKRSS